MQKSSCFPIALKSDAFDAATISLRRGKYRARIGLGGKKKTIGRFPTAEEASEAYEAFARESYGEFYRPI